MNRSETSTSPPPTSPALPPLPQHRPLPTSSRLSTLSGTSHPRSSPSLPSTDTGRPPTPQQSTPTPTPVKFGYRLRELERRVSSHGRSAVQRGSKLDSAVEGNRTNRRHSPSLLLPRPRSTTRHLLSPLLHLLPPSSLSFLPRPSRRSKARNMPSYNLPHFPFIPPHPSTQKQNSSAVPPPPPSPRLHAPKAIRPAFVPLPLPLPLPPPPTPEGRPSSPSKRRRRGEGDHLEERESGRTADSAGEAKENRRMGESPLPDTPPATPPPSERSRRMRSSSRERSERVTGGRKHARSPSEGQSRKQHGHHHRRSSSISSISFPAALPPLTPRPSSPRQAPRPSPALHGLHLLSLRLRRAPPHPSPLAPSNSNQPFPPSRGRTPSPSPSPSSPALNRPPRPPLSKRYTRPFWLAYQSARSSVQQNSVPRFSTPLPPPPPTALFPPTDAPPPSPEARLIEQVTHLTLHRRLLSRLVLSRTTSFGGERAGLGGLKAGREMVLWAACVRTREREERRKRVWSGEERGFVPELARPEGAHCWREEETGAGREGAVPLGGLPPLGDGAAGQSRGGRGHSRGYSSPVGLVAPPGLPVPPLSGSVDVSALAEKPKHKRRLSSLSLSSFVSGGLPSLKRSFSSPSSSSLNAPLAPTPPTLSPSPSPDSSPSPSPKDRLSSPSPSPFPLRRSFSAPSSPTTIASLTSSGHSFSPSAEDDLPLSIRARLPRRVERAVVRPEACCAGSSIPATSSFSTAPSLADGDLSALYAADFPSSLVSLPSPWPLPKAPPPLPLAPPLNEKRSLLPSHLALHLAAGWAGGRSGRGLEDWSKGLSSSGPLAVAGLPVAGGMVVVA